jgi:hypothetical protein
MLGAVVRFGQQESAVNGRELGHYWILWPFLTIDHAMDQP